MAAGRVGSGLRFSRILCRHGGSVRSKPSKFASKHSPNTHTASWTACGVWQLKRAPVRSTPASSRYGRSQIPYTVVKFVAFEGIAEQLYKPVTQA